MSFPEFDYIDPNEYERDTMPSLDRAAQVRRAQDFVAKVRAAKGFRFHWAAMDRMVGVLLPTWLVTIGARPKGGKTTTLMNLFDGWTDQGIRCAYLGTETGVESLTVLFACISSGVDFDAYVEGEASDIECARVDAHLKRQAGSLAETALFGECRGATVDGVIERAAELVGAGARIILLDYLQRLEPRNAQQTEYGVVSEACRRFKDFAEKYNVLWVQGAQLNMGPGLCAEYEVPGNGSWYMGKRPQQESDVALQQWRPFRKGITKEQKQQANDGEIEVTTLVQTETMAVRVAAHRWRQNAAGQATRLRIGNGQIHDWRD